jgi:hypothetical protein
VTIRTWFSLSLGLVALTACSKGGPPVHVAQTPPSAARAFDSLALQVFSIAQDTVLTPLVAGWPVAHEATASVDRASDPEHIQASWYYKVQLFTTKALAKAVAVRDEAEVDFGVKVDVEFETPYYKVRVGHFSAPADAEVLLSEARRLGYRGAWAVRLRVQDAN